MKSNDISRIKFLANKRRYDEALALCDKLYCQESGDYIDILRARAYVHSMSGNYDCAIRDYRIILESGEAELGDWYLAADNALEAERYTDAVELFSEVIRLGELQNNTWFRSAALFYLAYGLLMTGKPGEAMNSLSLAVSMSPDIRLYLPRLGVSDAERLRVEIAKSSKFT